MKWEFEILNFIIPKRNKKGGLGNRYLNEEISKGSGQWTMGSQCLKLLESKKTDYCVMPSLKV